MRIALYTIFRCTNYGAVLQAYALSRVLRRIRGEDAVDVINHRMDPRDNHLLGKITNPNTPWFQRWRNRRKFLSRYHGVDLFEERRRKTIQLIEREIRPTRKIYLCPEEFSSLPSYDTVVVGSDQIWNPHLNNDFGCNQYLTSHFPDSQDRVAYAASFGVSDFPGDSDREYKKALARFRAITVREESGALICEKLIGSRPPVVLDPTMLFAAEDWLNAVGKPARADSGYLAAYWVRGMTQADVDALARIAEKKKLSCRLMSAGPLPKLHFPENVDPFIDADPFDFVRTVAGSEGVVTDSFHGLQFAVVFSRPVLPLCESCSATAKSSRLVDFCTRYLNADICADIEEFRKGEKFGLSSEFDLGKLASNRAESLSLLKEIVGI